MYKNTVILLSFIILSACSKTETKKPAIISSQERIRSVEFHREEVRVITIPTVTITGSDIDELDEEPGPTPIPTNPDIRYYP